VPGYEKYFDYYRFSVLDYLKNQHATKNFFGNIVDFTRSTRSDKKARLFMRWGWGGLGSGPYTPIEYNKKYNFRRFYTHITRKYSAHYSKPPFPWYGIWRSWDGYTPERAKKLEEITYEAVKELPDYKYLETAVSGEVDGRQKMLLAGKYDDYIKLMLAARKGAKRARKDIVFLPDSGTSFFRPIRGYKEAEAMLKSTAKVAPKGFKWDALATHPYGDVDMLDERAAHFKKIAAKYGHEDVPLQFIECFNITDLYLPSWKANTWGDTYWNGRPTYDTGWAEYRQAAWASRIYIVCLKHWPRLEFVNIWRSKPYVDEQLTPLMLCGAVNNLGHLFASPKFKADIRPVDGIRCYVFEDHKKRGLAAVWTTVSEVDRGYREPARLKIELKGERPEIIDIMGNKRSYEVVNGETVLPLTSAPLFIRGADADKITEIFSDAKVIGSNMAVKAMILPQLEGQIKAEIFNRTTQALEGEIKVDGKTRHFKIDKIPGKVDVVLKKADNKTRPGVMYSWNKKLQISLSNGGKSEEEAGLKYFYAPRTDKTLPLDPFAPEWDKIPAVKLDNVVLSKKMNSRATKDSGREGDSSASYQVAWDKNNLYLKVNYEDDELLGPAKKWLDYPAVKRNQTLYMNDAALEVYIDTAADGRSNPRKWYDEDDYRYDFYGNGPEGIYRRQEVNQQLAGGVDFLSKKEAARTIRHKFVRKDNKAWYVIIFPQVTIEPFALMPGKQAGFGIFVHDFDTNDRHGLSNSTENGEHCNYRPDRWPVIVLEK
jgi:hypothetical protein